MKTNDATRANAEALPDLGDLTDKLCRIRSLVEILFLAGEGMEASHVKNAVTTQCDVIDDQILEAKAMIKSMLTRQNGGEA